MNRARIWTGVVILMGLLTGVVVANSAWLLREPPAVKGTVHYRGHPLRDSWVCFTSLDRERSGDMGSWTDSDGHFACQPPWWRPGEDRTSFQIWIIPDPRTPPAAEVRAHRLAEQATEEGTEVPLRRPVGNARRFFAATAPGKPVAGRPNAPMTGRSIPTSDPTWPRPMQVSLGSEPAEIEIDLED